ncbi:MAG: hypothetical protein R2748_22240 [Bryobacterales bacterium]
MRGSEFFQNMRMMAEPQPGEGGELSEDDRMKQKAMEVFENIESLVSASYYEDPESPDDREDLFVMRGSFDAAKMDALLADAPGEKTEHRGIVIRKLPRDLDPPEEEQEEAAEPEPPVCLAFLGETFAAGGAEQLVRQAIDRHLDGAEASNGGLFALGDPVPEGFQLWHIVNAKPLQAMAPPPEAASPEDGPAGMAAGMLSGLVGDMDHVRFAIQLTDGIGLRLEGLFNSPDKAKMASQAFAGLLAIAQMAGAGRRGGGAGRGRPRNADAAGGDGHHQVHRGAFRGSIGRHRAQGDRSADQRPHVRLHVGRNGRRDGRRRG